MAEIHRRLLVLLDIAPELVGSELGSLVFGLEERLGTCAACGRRYVRKRYRGRGRFCRDACRLRAYRNRKRSQPPSP